MRDDAESVMAVVFILKVINRPVLLVQIYELDESCVFDMGQLCFWFALGVRKSSRHQATGVQLCLTLRSMGKKRMF